MKEKYKKDFIVIPGLEYTTYRVHLCFLGITEWDCENDIPKNPTDQEIKEAINKAHQMGGVVLVTHYPWSTWGLNPRMPDHPTREQMYSWGVDLIECANWEDDISLVDYTSYDFSKTHPNIGACCGTDIHDPHKAPLCGWTLLKAETFSQEGIIKELREHRTEVILKPEGLKYHIKHKENLWYKVLRPFIMYGEKLQEFYLGGKLTNLDILGIISWFSYFFIIFIIIEIIIFIT